MARHSSGLSLSSDSHRLYSGYSESCFVEYFKCRAHQLVHAGDESGHQGVLIDVMQKDSRMKG